MGPDFLALAPFAIGLIARKGTMQFVNSDLMPFYVTDIHHVLLGVFGFCAAIVELSLAFFLGGSFLDADHRQHGCKPLQQS